MEQQKLPNSTLILVLGILSIITCCCYGIIGLILGIIAIVLANKAREIHLSNPNEYSGYSNVTTGKVLAIIGIVLSVLYLIFVIWAIMTFGFENLQNQEVMQEKMRELMSK